jgi:hypothetical protein
VTVSRSTLALIGARYRDTQHDAAYIDELERELTSRGVVGAWRWALELYAAGGLWWNVVWWEWCGLDGRDMLLGWILNLILGGFAATAVWYCFGLAWGLAVALPLLAFVVSVGLSLRSGTIAEEPEA